MRGWLVAFLLVLAAPAAGQTVQKCIDYEGRVLFTSGPCPVGQREDARYAAAPDREDPQAWARKRAELERWQRAQQASRPAQGFVTPWASTPDTRGARCAAARKERDAALERLGLRRTHADLRRWDDYVYEACK